MRTILSGNTPLDRYMNGEREALSPQARQGLGIRGKGNCTACHVGPTLTDEQFHNTGVAWKDPSTFHRVRVVPSPVEGRQAQGRPERSRIWVALR